MRLTASAPASCAARTKGRTSGTFGASLGMMGSVVAARTARTTSAKVSTRVPKLAPPSLTLGQETLSSSMATPGLPSSAAATWAYSSALVPQMLTMAGTPRAARKGRSSAMKASTPGPCRPMALSRPPGTSAWRGRGLPGQGRARTPLTVTAPRRETSKKASYSWP